jgi:predicted DNA-binding protein
MANEGPTVATSFRLRPDVLEKLRVLAEFEARSQANMIKVLVEQAYGTARYRLEPHEYEKFEEVREALEAS